MSLLRKQSTGGKDQKTEHTTCHPLDHLTMKPKGTFCLYMDEFGLKDREQLPGNLSLYSTDSDVRCKPGIYSARTCTCSASSTVGHRDHDVGYTAGSVVPEHIFSTLLTNTLLPAIGEYKIKQKWFK